MTTKSKSRKVNGYIKVYLKWQDLSHKADVIYHDVQIRRGALNGAQMAEANRILGQVS